MEFKNKNGFFKTGDLGYIDSEGFLFITGRKKDIINVGGFKVSSLEIKNYLLKLEEIKEVAVVPIYDKIQGEVPGVLIKINKFITRKKILNCLRKNLTNYAIPNKICFTEIIPKSETGKILSKEVINILEKNND